MTANHRPVGLSGDRRRVRHVRPLPDRRALHGGSRHGGQPPHPATGPLGRDDGDTPSDATGTPPRSEPGRAASMQERVDDLARLRAEVRSDERAAERQHPRGKLTARERLDLLCDPGSFVELGGFRRHAALGTSIAATRPAGDGVITGWGTVDGRRVYVYAHDFSVFGGALGAVFAAKIHRLLDLAAKAGAPVIGLNDGAGARIQEGVAALHGYGGIFSRSVQLSGVVPQLSAILGPCAGGAAYAPALTDFTFMVEGTATSYLTGPEVVRAVTGEDVDHEQLGGARVHARQSGLVSRVAEDDAACLDDLRWLLSFLPSNNLETPPHVATDDDPDRSCPELRELVPAEPSRPYDMRAVLHAVVDDGEFFEIGSERGPSLICGFARLDGHAIGVVASQPQVMAGTLDTTASEKGARFVRTCDAFNVPLVTFVDVPGFLPGTDQEHAGAIRHGAKLLYAYCEATVPRVQMIVRKAYGGAYIVMDSLSIGADLAFAWPSNEIAVMGADGAVDVLHRRELAAASDPERLKADLTRQYRDALLAPYLAAEQGFVDDVIDPAETRAVVARALASLRAKRSSRPARKHGNPPL